MSQPLTTLIITRELVGRVLVIKGDYEWYVPARTEATETKRGTKHDYQVRIKLRSMLGRGVRQLTVLDLAREADCSRSLATKVLNASQMERTGTRPFIYRLPTTPFQGSVVPEPDEVGAGEKDSETGHPQDG